jgi:glutamate-1-semialdehyde aminotransferase
MAANQQMAQQNSQMQAQVQAQAAQAASQGRMQEMQMEAQIESQMLQMKTQMEAQMEQIKHEHRKEIELIRAQATLGFKTGEQEFKEKLEVLKEDRKDERVEKQAVEQSKLISQRKGDRGELKKGEKSSDTSDIIDQLINQ